MPRRKQVAEPMDKAVQNGTMRVLEAVKFTGMKQGTIRKLIRCGRLRTSKPNGCVLILKDDVLRLLADGMKRKC